MEEGWGMLVLRLGMSSCGVVWGLGKWMEYMGDLW